MLWGYFMKLVVADRLGIYVDAVYSSVVQHNGTSLLFATVLHPFQVYTDLGGYTIVAMGTAKVLGFDIMPNFNRPFFAVTMAEFWRRWHMSLITWLTDYVYTPLSFSLRRLRLAGIIIALMLTFLISGIWHGAKMTYVVWGLMQGFFLSMEALTSKSRITLENKLRIGKSPLYLFFSMLVTFCLFAASLVFGRAGNMPDAWLVYEKIFTEPGPIYLDKTTLTYALAGLSFVLIKDFRDEFFPEQFRLFNSRSIIVRYASYLFIIFCILLFGVLNGGQFIYFKF
jgi:D-alanyl-lipoteichoic acid acyltransferase DltB (MBOAT superfamily)